MLFMKRAFPFASLGNTPFSLTLPEVWPLTLHFRGHEALLSLLSARMAPPPWDGLSPALTVRGRRWGLVKASPVWVSLHDGVEGPLTHKK